MNIWCICKNMKPATAKQIRAVHEDFCELVAEDELICATTKKSILMWINAWNLEGFEARKIWSCK